VADVLDALNRLGAIVVGAAQEIVQLREALAEARSQTAAPAPEHRESPPDGVKRPALPRPRKRIGNVFNSDGAMLEYSADEMSAHGTHCFNAGWRAAQPPLTGGYSKANELEDDAWNEHKTNGGPRPTAPSRARRKK